MSKVITPTVHILIRCANGIHAQLLISPSYHPDLPVIRMIMVMSGMVNIQNVHKINRRHIVLVAKPNQLDARAPAHADINKSIHHAKALDQTSWNVMALFPRRSCDSPRTNVRQVAVPLVSAVNETRGGK